MTTRFEGPEKSKYGTLLLRLSVHGVRMEFGNRTGTALEPHEIKPANVMLNRKLMMMIMMIQF